MCKTMIEWNNLPRHLNTRPLIPPFQAGKWAEKGRRERTFYSSLKRFLSEWQENVSLYNFVIAFFYISYRDRLSQNSWNLLEKTSLPTAYILRNSIQCRPSYRTFLVGIFVDSFFSFVDGTYPRIKRSLRVLRTLEFCCEILRGVWGAKLNMISFSFSFCYWYIFLMFSIYVNVWWLSE